MRLAELIRTSSSVIIQEYDPFLVAQPPAGRVTRDFSGRVRAARRRQWRLARLFSNVAGERSEPGRVTRIRKISHGLAIAAGPFGFKQISSHAAALGDAVAAPLDGGRLPKEATHAIDRLMARMEREWDAPRMPRKRGGAIRIGSMARSR